MSLRLEERQITIDGVTYPLRCNMAVLEKLQDGVGEGEIGKLLETPTYKVVFEILKAMLDDACEDDPELPKVSMRTLKKKFSPAQLGKIGVFRLFVNALAVNPVPVSEPDTAGDGEPEPEQAGN